MKATLKAGVQVIAAPQLFPTPPDLAARMVELADLKPGLTVLEPSAGTGNIANPIRSTGAAVVCVEINPILAKTLSDAGHAVHLADFLQWEPASAVQEVASRASRIPSEEIARGDEIWKPVVGYETVYEVSSWGRIRRLVTVKGRNAGDFVNGGKRADGYINIMLCKGGEATSRLMHQIVMDAFVGPCPEGMEINHRHPDGDKSRNWLSNLEYTTSPENNRDQIERRPSNYNRGDVHPRSKLTRSQIPGIKERIRSGEDSASIAEAFGVTAGTISAIASGKTWRDPLLFDRVIANPPFVNGADCAHIRHALTFLRQGGRLVAICANGPRQQAELRPLATTWEELPEGTFAAQGTNVRTVLLTIDA
jgi:protein-L-isoaspartate O-methyltransferase